MQILKFLAVVMLALVLCAGPALAENAGKEEHGSKEGGKIDPVDKFGLKRYDLGIYTLIVFFILLGILGKYAWGPMMKGLDKREETLRKAHDDAAASRSEAERALADVKAQLAKTAEEVRGMLAEARRDGQVVKDQLKAEAATEIQAERDRVRREIETAKDAALKEIYEQSIQLATMVSAKAIKRELTAGDHQRLLDDALADLRTNLGRDRRVDN
jgi:F-type H+-transporting ATPase subunit b